MKLKHKYTPEEFCEHIAHLDSMTNDNEALHLQTDKAMEELLISLGYDEGVQFIRDTTRWYA